MRSLLSILIIVVPLDILISGLNYHYLNSTFLILLIVILSSLILEESNHPSIFKNLDRLNIRLLLTISFFITSIEFRLIRIVLILLEIIYGIY